MVMRDRGFLEAEVPRWLPDVITFESEEVVIPRGVYLPLGPFDSASPPRQTPSLIRKNVVIAARMAGTSTLQMS